MVAVDCSKHRTISIMSKGANIILKELDERLIAKERKMWTLNSTASEKGKVQEMLSSHSVQFGDGVW